MHTRRCRFRWDIRDRTWDDATAAYSIRYIEDNSKSCSQCRHNLEPRRRARVSNAVEVRNAILAIVTMRNLLMHKCVRQCYVYAAHAGWVIETSEVWTEAGIHDRFKARHRLVMHDTTPMDVLGYFWDGELMSVCIESSDARFIVQIHNDHDERHWILTDRGRITSKPLKLDEGMRDNGLAPSVVDVFEFTRDLIAGMLI